MMTDVHEGIVSARHFAKRVRLGLPVDQPMAEQVITKCDAALAALTPQDRKSTIEQAGLRERLQALLQRASKGPWDWDTEDNEGSYGDGGPDARDGYKSAYLVDADGKRMFDAINSDAGCVHEEVDGDEEGTWLNAWDDASYANAELIVFLKNNADAILAMLPGGGCPEGWVLVPKEPTEAMLRSACSAHAPGQPMNAKAEPGSYSAEECPRFGKRRRIWASMLSALPEGEK